MLKAVFLFRHKPFMSGSGQNWLRSLSTFGGARLSRPTIRSSLEQSVAPPEKVDHWRSGLPEGRSVVVYCAHGQEVSQNTAAALRAAGSDACYLEHGIGGWAELGLPRRRKLGAGSDGWVTRERPKIDRIACPWLIRRFIDPEARFLFAPTEGVFAVAAELSLIHI